VFPFIKILFQLRQTLSRARQPSLTSRSRPRHTGQGSRRICRWAFSSGLERSCVVSIVTGSLKSGFRVASSLRRRAANDSVVATIEPHADNNCRRQQAENSTGSQKGAGAADKRADRIAARIGKRS